MTTATRTALVRPVAAHALHLQDYNRVTIPRAPWEGDVGAPDPRPETAPREAMPARYHSGPARPSAEEMLARVRRAIRDVAREAGHG